MINVGLYEYGGKIKLTLTDGRVFIGDADVATMKEDEEEIGIDNPSDWLTVIIGDKAVDFSSDEIVNIEKIA